MQQVFILISIATYRGAYHKSFLASTMSWNHESLIEIWNFASNSTFVSNCRIFLWNKIERMLSCHTSNEHLTLCNISEFYLTVNYAHVELETLKTHKLTCKNLERERENALNEKATHTKVTTKIDKYTINAIRESIFCIAIVDSYSVHIAQASSIKHVDIVNSLLCLHITRLWEHIKRTAYDFNIPSFAKNVNLIWRFDSQFKPTDSIDFVNSIKHFNFWLGGAFYEIRVYLSFQSWNEFWIQLENFM